MFRRLAARDHAPQRYSHPGSPSSHSLPVLSARSGRVPRELLDALENLPEEAPRQVALGQLENEVPSMPEEAPAGLEQPLQKTREGPALDGHGQDEPTQQIAEVVGNDPEQQVEPGDRCAAAQRAQAIGLTTFRAAPRLPPTSLLPRLEVRPGGGVETPEPVDAKEILAKK